MLFCIITSDFILLLLIFHYDGHLGQSLIYILLYPSVAFWMLNVVICWYLCRSRVTVLT